MNRLLAAAFAAHRDLIAREVLATALTEASDLEGEPLAVGDHDMVVKLTRSD